MAGISTSNVYNFMIGSYFVDRKLQGRAPEHDPVEKYLKFEKSTFEALSALPC